MRSSCIVLYVLAAGCAADAGPTTTDEAQGSADCADREGLCATNRLPPHGPFRVLQLNLCNSGLAGCYDGGKAVPEAATVIQGSAPDVVTLNEVCAGDVPQLSSTLAGVYASSTVVWAFQAAVDRRTGAAYKCKNGQDYGIGLVAHVPGTYAGHRVFGGIYASQDTGSAEERAWLCIHATDSFYACTTHLASTSGSVALAQCKDLMNQVIPAVRAGDGGDAPTVVGGDLNLKFRGSPDAQRCVPAGYFRKGDGDVQHILATSNFAFSASRTIGMSHTDHDGWFVALTAP